MSEVRQEAVSNTDDELPAITYQQAKSMTISQLREEMIKRGINAKGTKKNLLGRIRYYTGRGMFAYDETT